jgi:hypothetical protein
VRIAEICIMLESMVMNAYRKLIHFDQSTVECCSMFPLNVGMVVVCYQATYNILLNNDRNKSYIHMVLHMVLYNSSSRDPHPIVRLATNKYLESKLIGALYWLQTLH